MSMHIENIIVTQLAPHESITGKDLHYYQFATDVSLKDLPKGMIEEIIARAIIALSVSLNRNVG